MPRPKFRPQHGGAQRNGQKNYGKKHGKDKKFVGNRVKKRKQLTTGATDNVGRKYKFIRRNQESEEALRQQKKLEESYLARNNVTQSIAENDDLECSSEEEVDPMQQLMSTLAAGGQKVYSNTNKAIESSESESESESESDGENDDQIEDDHSESENVHELNSFEGMDAENIDDDDDDYEGESDGDDTFPEKFEEQSQPRGEKYHSSDDESVSDDHKEEQSDSEDDLPEDTILRPEGSKTNKSFDDSVESEEQSEIDDDDDESTESDQDESSDKNSSGDMFSIHLDNDLSPELLDCVNTTHFSRKEILNWPTLGRLQLEIPTATQKDSNALDGGAKKKKKLKTLLDDDIEYATDGTNPTLYDNKNVDLEQLNVKIQLQPNVVSANKSNLNESSAIFTNLQCELFSIMNNYQDLFYQQRNNANGEEIRFIYSLHALNHILKTRAKVLNHNLKLKLMTGAENKSSAIVPDKYRDQGLFRTKVLIVVPFRESALRIVNLFISLLFPAANSANASGASKQVMHYKRFLDEFGGESLHFPKKNPKPEDYELTFAGNSDDTFRIGITFTRKCMKLYSDFYSSDILIVSPLGLRMIVGAPGDKERDYDFLASIELLILDQAEIFMAQNWDHLLHILDHLHLQPQSARNTDFSRVRSWCLNGWTRFYRQTLLFSSHELAEFRSLFNSRCCNYRGKVRLANPITNGSIKHVAVQIAQIFHRIDVSSIQSSFDQRFDHFVNNVLPTFKSASKAHCLVFIPSYFDFVRIRNYFKRETINFVQICEYTKDGKIDRARSMFFHSGAHFMLYSERAHFFRRTRLKGIRHLIMYQPPTWPHFYAEMINLMQDANQNPRDGGENSMSVTILYTKYDILQIASIVGSDQASEMATSDKSTHMFMTGD